jgi:hypothetical protein
MASTALATDTCQVDNPLPVEGFRAYVQTCLTVGFTEADTRRMGAKNIGDWLAQRVSQESWSYGRDCRTGVLHWPLPQGGPSVAGRSQRLPRSARHKR